MSEQPRLILGIESTCDETGAAVVDASGRVLSNAVATQHAVHERFGGVVPELASREHLRNLIPVLEAALDAAEVDRSALGAVAVAHRPGLIGSLICGVAAAKALAWSLGLPLIGVDHVHAHLSAALLRTGPASDAGDDVPDAGSLRGSLGLVVSGGHTALYELADPARPTRLGGTIDDAAGEAFDKAAVVLGLGHPGGPALDTLAEGADGSDEASADTPRLPVSMLERDSLDFSFSGLKTAFLYAVRGRPQGRGKSAAFPRSVEALSAAERAAFAAAFRDAVVTALERKTDRAFERLTEAGRRPRGLVIGGGVAANRLLRRRFAAWGRLRAIPVWMPDLSVCLDNAAMIAGHAHLMHGWSPAGADEPGGLDLPALPTGR